MSIPSPPFELVNHCSAIWNNTLYVYSQSGFASLALEEDAEWQTLAPGQAVTGGACVPAGDQALYIVGGSAGATGALTGYMGLQRYNYAAGSWENLPVTSPVLQNRLRHGAAYIPSLNSILVYAGTRDAGASGLGQETFVVSTTAPYDIVSQNAQGAPALTAPTLMPWSSELAVLVGGAAENLQVWLYGQSLGWTTLETTLPPGLGLDSGAKKCTIVTGQDGSKVLQIFDMSKSPNEVSRYALLINGAAATSGMRVGDASTRRRLRTKRQTIDNWPAYNGTLAPTTTRDGFSVASDSNGLVVISGGNSEEPIAMFDQSTNTWQNATSVFVRDQQVLLNSISSSSSVAPSSTSAPASSSTSSAAPSSSPTGENVLGTGRSKSQVLTTLGATLGAVFGFAAILIIILLLLRYKKKQRKAAMAGGVNEKDQDRLSFADQGADFMKEAGGARGGAAFSPSPKSNHSSLTSLQIFQNMTNNGHKRAVPSDGSQVPLAKNKSPLGVSDPLEMSQMSNRSSPTFTMKSMDFEKPPISQPKAMTLTPAAAAAAIGTKDAKDGRTRSNGWSRYFANNDVTNLASIQSGQRNTYNTEVSAISDVSKTSDYSNDRSMARGSEVRPLELNLGPKFESQRLSAVNTGSPTMGRSKEDIGSGLQAELRRAGSTSSRASMDDGFEFSSVNPTPMTQSTWTPASRPSIERPSFDDRKADARSIRSNHSGGNPFFGSSRETDARSRKGSLGAPPMLPQLNLRAYGDASRDSTASNVTIFPSGLESPKGSAFAPTSRPAGAGAGEYDFLPPRNVFGGGQNYRDSSASDVTVFPGLPAGEQGSPVRGGDPRNGPTARKMSAPQDMGWLNLNAGKTS
jgi:hypothetical protein